MSARILSEARNARTRLSALQVLLNLVLNAIEAMSALEDERRILTICEQRPEMEAGALAFLHKPVAEQALINAIQAAFRSGRREEKTPQHGIK